MKRLLLVIPIIAIGLSLLFSNSSASKLNTGPTPLPNANEQEFTGAGIYQFYGQISDPEYAPWVKGAEYMFPWYSVECTVGNYDFSGIDSVIDNAISRGIKAGIKIEPLSWTKNQNGCVQGTNCATGSACTYSARKDGIYSPGDLLDAGDVNQTYFVCPLDNSSTGYHRIPNYKNSTWQTAYFNMYEALMDHLKADPARLAAVSQIDISTGNYGESNPGERTDQSCLLQKGLNESDWNSYVNDLIDKITLETSGTTVEPVLQGTTFYTNVDSRYDFNMYAASKGAGLYHSRVHADQESTYASYEQGQWDYILDTNNSVPYGAELPDPNDGYGGNLNEAEHDYWTLAFLLQDKSDYVRVRTFPRGTLKRISYDNPIVLGMVNEYNSLAGKIASTAPYAKVWMRETTSYWYPACGNFDYYMYASSATPPATSVCQPFGLSTTDGEASAVFNLDYQYQNLCSRGPTGTGPGVYDNDCDPRLKFARATTNSDPYIYFDVDTAYAYGVGSGIIRVEYLDNGTDYIQLQYTDSSGAAQARGRQKTNTNKVASWNITIDDIKLTDTLTSGTTTWDFRLYNNSDGNDTIHNVSFEKTSSFTDVPTATPTPTSTPTNAPTNTPTPWIITFDSNNSTWYDAGINGRYPTTKSGTASNMVIAASTATPIPNTGPYPTQYPNIRQSVVLRVDYTLPPGAYLGEALLCLNVETISGNVPRVWLSRNASTWDETEATWISRTSTESWPTPGAYPDLDRAGPFYIPNRTGEWCVPVENFVYSDHMMVKIEPACNITTSCYNDLATFSSSENLALDLRPKLVLRVAGLVPTATSTPTRTPTSLSTSTPTPTPTQTPTRTPTYTSTPTATRTPTRVPGAATATPTPTPTRTSTPTSTPTATSTPTSTSTPTATPTSSTPLSCGDCVIKITEVCLNPNQDLNGNGIISSGDRAIEITNLDYSNTVTITNWRLCSDNCILLRGTIGPRKSKVFYQIPDNITIGGPSYIVDYSTSPWTQIDSVNLTANAPGLCWSKTESDNSFYETTPSLGWLP